MRVFWYGEYTPRYTVKKITYKMISNNVQSLSPSVYLITYKWIFLFQMNFVRYYNMMALYVIITRLCTLFKKYFERYCNTVLYVI